VRLGVDPLVDADPPAPVVHDNHASGVVSVGAALLGDSLLPNGRQAAHLSLSCRRDEVYW
jgi:hypothetical protein